MCLPLGTSLSLCSAWNTPFFPVPSAARLLWPPEQCGPWTAAVASFGKLIEMHLLGLFLATSVWSSWFGAQQSGFYKPSRGFWHPLKFETASLQRRLSTLWNTRLIWKSENCWCSEPYSRTIKSESLGLGPRISIFKSAQVIPVCNQVGEALPGLD